MIDSYVGIITDFIVQRGFGFISSELDSFFFHRTNLVPDANGLQTLRVGDKVQFELGPNPKNGKRQAINVRRADVSEGAK